MKAFIEEYGMSVLYIVLFLLFSGGLYAILSHVSI